MLIRSPAAIISISVVSVLSKIIQKIFLAHTPSNYKSV